LMRESNASIFPTQVGRSLTPSFATACGPPRVVSIGTCDAQGRHRVKRSGNRVEHRVDRAR